MGKESKDKYVYRDASIRNGRYQAPRSGEQPSKERAVYGWGWAKQHPFQVLGWMLTTKSGLAVSAVLATGIWTGYHYAAIGVDDLFNNSDSRPPTCKGDDVTITHQMLPRDLVNLYNEDSGLRLSRESFAKLHPDIIEPNPNHAKHQPTYIFKQFGAVCVLPPPTTTPAPHHS